MASFQKRGNSWQFTISRVINGKQKPIRKGGFRTKKEAQAAAAEIESHLNKGILPHLKPEPFDQYFESWLKTFKPDISNNTMARYHTTLKTVQEYFGGVPIQDIKKRDYQAFLNEYGKNHAKDSTRKLNTHIRACVRTAMDEGIIYSDFTRGAVLTGTKGKRPEEKHLNFKESEILLKELHKRLDRSPTYYLLLLGLTTGMRFGEMVGLTRKDFDFKNRTIRIEKVWGYNNKMNPGFGPPKNEQSYRTIAIDQETSSIFKHWFEKTPDNIMRLVFYSPSSKYHVISNNSANKVLESTLRQLGIEPITVHGLRHTHASILLYLGVSIYYVSERLGHADIQTTLSTYAHIVKELRKQDEEKTTNLFARMLV
jgi:integrase